MFTFDFYYENGTNAVFEHVTSVKIDSGNGWKEVSGGEILKAYFDLRHNITLHSENATYWVTVKDLRHLEITKEK